MHATVHPHVAIRKDGIPVVRGTQFKIIQIIRDHVQHGLRPDQIQQEHPGLTLAQIHGTLAYYYDHKSDLDAMLRERAEGAEQILRDLPPTVARERLRQAKLRR
jgi:uncharacterized protein (DUF433 family)